MPCILWTKPQVCFIARRSCHKVGQIYVTGALAHLTELLLKQFLALEKKVRLSCFC